MALSSYVPNSDLIPTSISTPRLISSHSIPSTTSSSCCNPNFNLSRSFILRQIKSKSSNNQSQESKKQDSNSNYAITPSKNISALLIPDRSIEIFNAQTQQPLSSHSLPAGTSSCSSPLTLTRTLSLPSSNPTRTIIVRTTYLLVDDGNELWAWNVRTDRDGNQIDSDAQDDADEGKWKWGKEILRLPAQSSHFTILPTSELLLYTPSNSRIFVSHTFFPPSLTQEGDIVSNLLALKSIQESEPSSTTSILPSSSGNEIFKTIIKSVEIHPYPLDLKGTESNFSKSLISTLQTESSSHYLKENNLVFSSTGRLIIEGTEDEVKGFEIRVVEVQRGSQKASFTTTQTQETEKSKGKKRSRNSAMNVIDEADNEKAGISTTSFQVFESSLRLEIGLIISLHTLEASSSSQSKKNKGASLEKGQGPRRRYLKLTETDLLNSGLGLGIEKVDEIRQIKLSLESGQLGFILKNGSFVMIDFRFFVNDRKVKGIKESESGIQIDKPKRFHLKSNSVIQSLNFLSSTHLLLLSFNPKTSSDQDPILQTFILDLELSCILSFNEMKVSDFQSQNHEVEFHLEVLKKGGKVLDLLISSTPLNENRDGKKNGKGKNETISKSKFFTMDYSIPSQSVLIQAIRASELNQRFLISGPSVPTSKKDEKEKDGSNGLSEEENQLIKELKEIQNQVDNGDVEMNGNSKTKGEKVDEKFFDWLNLEEGRREFEWKKSLTQDLIDQHSEQEDSEDETTKKSKGSAKKGSKKEVSKEEKKKQKQNPNFGGDMPGKFKVQFRKHFVASLLNVALPFSNPKKKDQPLSHSPKLIAFLLKNGYLSNGLYNSLHQTSQSNLTSNSSILLRLLDFNDWENIIFGIYKIKDLTEDELVCLLVNRVKSSSTPSISLQFYLSQLVALPISPPLLRKSFKNRMGLEELLPVLKICQGWLEENKTLTFDSTESNQERGGRKKELLKIEEMDQNVRPKIDDVIQFLTHLLDVFFPLLLSSPNSHQLLHSLSTSITELTNSLSMLNLLATPLKVFDQIQKDWNTLDEKVKGPNFNSKVQQVRVEKVNLGNHFFEKKPQSQLTFGNGFNQNPTIKNPSMKILNGGGVSNIDEFGLSKNNKAQGKGGKGADQKGRVRRLEDSARVGPYSIEILDL